jgi:hypothetical protein
MRSPHQEMAQYLPKLPPSEENSGQPTEGCGSTVQLHGNQPTIEAYDGSDHNCTEFEI